MFELFKFCLKIHWLRSFLVWIFSWRFCFYSFIIDLNLFFILVFFLYFLFLFLFIFFSLFFILISITALLFLLFILLFLFFTFPFSFCLSFELLFTQSLFFLLFFRFKSNNHFLFFFNYLFWFFSRVFIINVIIHFIHIWCDLKHNLLMLVEIVNNILLKVKFNLSIFHFWRLTFQNRFWCFLLQIIDFVFDLFIIDVSNMNWFLIWLKLWFFLLFSFSFIILFLNFFFFSRLCFQCAYFRIIWF